MKALTFGTGVFLRGFFCDFADRAGVPVVMSSSTLDGDRRAERMNAAGGQFHLIYRGIGTDGQPQEDTRQVSAVERVIPSTAWAEVLTLAHNPDFSLIVTNVSEAGFKLPDDPTTDTFDRPVSFPARLTRWLYERWQVLSDAPVTVLPCELFEDNGTKLRAMVQTIVTNEQLPEPFQTYLAEKVTIADTLVDRIVTGEIPSEDLPTIVCEPFALWAIHGDETVKTTLTPFLRANPGESPSEFREQIVVAPDIAIYTLKKVRFLNALHSAMAALGPLEYGVSTVLEAVTHPELGPFLSALLLEEILPANAPPLDPDDARVYAETTWNRMRNPFLAHKLSDINKGAAAKWPVRIYPTIETYTERFGIPPERLVRCRAAFDRMVQ